MIKVYIASPYSNGDQAASVNCQIQAANELMDCGFAPFTPLLFHFHHLVFQRSYDDWLKLDMVWLEQCDCVLRLPIIMKSKGVELEIKKARELNIPVFDDIKELDLFYNV